VSDEPKRETVGDVMSDAILVCRGKTPVASAARAMTSSGWRSVLVVDAKGKVLGVVSGNDLLPLVKTAWTRARSSAM
jgi:CBS domain-containing protein